MTYTPTKWVNGGKPAINAENLNKIEEALAQLSVPDITETTSTTQPNSYAGRENILEIGGVTEQDSTSGKNLLENTATTQTINGGTFTINEDKSITVNGTFTATTFLKIGGVSLKGNQSYILSGCPSGGSAYNYLISLRSENTGTVYTDDTGSGAKYTPTEDMMVYPLIRIQSGTSMNHTFYPMIRLASVEDATYEPYTNGASPNPSYPQEIKKSVVSGVKTHGKNILNCQGLTEQTFHGVTFTPSYDANGNLLYIEVNGTASGGVSTYYLSTFKFDSNKPCILSGCPSGGSDSKYTIYTENSAVGTDYGSGVSITSDLSANIRIGVANGVTVTNLRFYPMVRFADVIDGTYEPYTESSYTFSQPIELYGMNGVQDVITPKEVNRKWTKKRITSSMNISHEAGWAYPNAVFIASFFPAGVKVSDYTTVANILCTHAVTAPPANIANGSAKNAVGQGGDDNLFFSFENCTTVEEVKAFLDENEVYVYYQLRTPTTEALPIADQIGLNSLATYDGITYVEFIYEGPQPTLKAEYGTSKVGGYTLEAMLAGRNGELRGV